MTPLFPILELADRLAIAEIKFERTAANQAELDWYTEQFAQYNSKSVRSQIDALKEIHNEIWDLEWQLKSGREQELPLEEIGRRAIAIRDHNNRRIAIKNALAEQLECPVREIKRDHLSE
jgi:uncharacterized protein YxjI